MKAIKLFLPGAFEDAYLYKAHLLAITEERTLRAYSMDRLVDLLNGWFPDERPVHKLMFSRNDWLVGGPFGSLMNNRGVALGLLGAFARASKEAVTLDEAVLRGEERSLDIPATVLLDVMLYNDRMYVGADTGLYDIDVSLKTKFQSSFSRPTKRSDARCLRTSARYGTINASCGDDGLLAAVNDFGGIAQETRPRLEQVADRSLRADWISHDLVNYSNYSTPVLLRNSYEKEDLGGSTSERTLITEMGREKLDLTYLLSEVRNGYGVEQDAVQFSYNSNNTFFVHTIDGDFYSLSVRNAERHEPTVRFSRTHKGAGTRILSASHSKVGVVVETDSRVLLFSGGDWFPIDESEAISVRTFSNSRRYQNIVAITKEDGLLLAGLFDDEPHRPPIDLSQERY